MNLRGPAWAQGWAHQLWQEAGLLILALGVVMGSPYKKGEWRHGCAKLCQSVLHLQ